METKPLRRLFQSLIPRLALAYLGLALLAALTVRAVTLTAELEALDREVRTGWLDRAAAAAVRTHVGMDPATMDRFLATAEASTAAGEDILSELKAPLVSQLTAPDGRVLAQRGDPRGAAWARARARMPDGRALIVTLKPPRPSVRALVGDHLEWPALLIYALVFAAGSVLLLRLSITRRLATMGTTTSAWSKGDFARLNDDPSSDEIGALARRLDAMAGQLEALLKQRADMADAEARARLARDLHDTVKQKAFALQLQLAAAARTGGAEVASALVEARALTREIQQALTGLLAPALAGADPMPNVTLADDLVALARDWSRRGGFEAVVHADPGIEAPANCRHEVLRVAGEALANVMRHAGAQRVTMALERASGGARLVIEDDGRGPGSAVEGMGLANMRSRAAGLPGGALMLEAIDPGTRLTLDWSTVDSAAR